MKARRIILPIVAVLCVMLCAACFWGCGGNDDGNEKPSAGQEPELTYILNYDKTSYSCTGIGVVTATDIVIAQTYKGLPVTSIGERAFFGCSSLTSVKILDGVTSIGSGAFYNCNSLTSIEMPDRESINVLHPIEFI